MFPILQKIYFNNTVLDYLMFFSALIVSFILIRFIGSLLIKRLSVLFKKTVTSADNHFVKAIKKNLITILYFIAFYFSARILTLDPTLKIWIDRIILAFTIAVCASFTSTITAFAVNKYMKHKISDANNLLLLRWTNGLIKAVVWSVALVLFLDNIGVRITSLITGLGIGGIALAFAAQNILVDIFCCFTILFDKPFEIGDFITAGQHTGTVEHIGVKTTRLRALTGEQIVLSNSDLTSSRINNFKTLKERRILFRIGVTYSTDSEKLKEIPGLLKRIIENTGGVRFGRAHFCNYGTYSLEFEIAYYILSSDYDRYMDINQEIFYRIKEEFDGRGIEFAFPTQALYINNLKNMLPS